MKFIVVCFMVLLSWQADAKVFSVIKEEVDQAIDEVCELHEDADRVLLRLGNRLIDRVNSAVSSILDAYQLDCLSDLLKLSNLGIPGFDDIINLDFCQIIRSEILATGFDGISFKDMSVDEVAELKAKIIARHEQREQFLEMMRGEKES